ncbi:MAG: glycosyltransferase family 39 protein [Microcoleaceae cyanobacterium]
MRTKGLNIFSLEVFFSIAIGLGVFLRIIFLDQREFWYDEVLSLMIAAGNLTAYVSPDSSEFPVLLSNYTKLFAFSPSSAQLFGSISDQSWLQGLEAFLKTLWQEPHPPLFYLSQQIWQQLFGNSVAAARSLNALISIIAIGSSYGLGQVVLGQRGGLSLAALMALNPFFLSYSLNLRMYCPTVLWATLSAWALLQLIRQRKQSISVPWWQGLGWSTLLAVSVACGLMTFYLFAYFVLALGVLAVFLERKLAWRYGLLLGLGGLLTLPWMIWGFSRQLDNVDLARFNRDLPPVEFLLQQFQGILKVLGNLLLSGEWGSDLSLTFQLGIGAVVVIVLLLCGLSLSRQREYPTLVTALILGLLPLGLIFGADLLMGKMTLDWGTGRSVIFALPGCLLLIVIWMELTAGRWRTPAACFLVILYGAISIGNYTLRSRTGMTELARIVEQDLTQPTLIAMNSSAWGHVLRLAYYIDPTAAVMLSAKPTPELIEALETQAQQYPRVILLESARPIVPNEPMTETERQQIANIMQQARMRFVGETQLSGTADIDRFTMRIYER